MSLFRRHEHDWTKWDLIHVDYRDPYNGSYVGTKTKQHRVCRTCGRYQLRRIGRR